MAYAVQTDAAAAPTAPKPSFNSALNPNKGNAPVSSAASGAGAGAGNGNGAAPTATTTTTTDTDPTENNNNNNNNSYSGGGGGGGKKKSKPKWETPTLPSAASQADYLAGIYDANNRAVEANLTNAYEQNLNRLNAEAEKIPGTYQEAANQAAAQAAINRANFNEYAAGNGLNAGAGSQARLAQNVALQNNITNVRRAQADAVSQINLQRAQLESEYKNQINEALAKNDLARAQALYQEAVRVDESLVNTAQAQANLDWTVWSKLYG